MTKSYLELIEQFPNLRVIVIGDAMLDHYVMGSVTRTSAEAPVPIHHAYGEEWVPGGAANVARNISALGAESVFFAVCGDDDAGKKLSEVLEEDKGIISHLLIEDDRPTTLKTRFVAKGQQMLRVDWEKTDPITKVSEDRIKQHLLHYMTDADGIILSDYAKGVLTPDLVQFIVEKAKENNVEILVDPKGRDFSKYKGVSCITPNKKEAQEASGITITDEKSAVQAAEKLQDIVDAKSIIITLSAGGVGVYSKGEDPVRVQASAKEVFDVTGAGDTFLAVMSCCRFAGAKFGRSAEVGNYAAGMAVARSGVSVISIDDLRSQVVGKSSAGQKWLAVSQLKERRRSFGRAGRKIVFTNGCFDLLSAVHIKLLEKARSQGDVLIVAINSDDSVRMLKGQGRPYLNLTDRIELLSSLHTVDYVTVFDGETPSELIKTLQPDILVKGNTGDPVVGREIVEKYGGKVVVIDVDENKIEAESAIADSD